jgi:F-type H+-transporting ATPase subunit b
MELLKLISASEVFAQLVSFLILFFLLKAFAWKRLLAMLDARRERIAGEFAAIETSKQEISRLKESYQQQLSQAQEMARRTVNEAVDEGKKARDEIRRQAHVDAQQIIEKAREDIKYEMGQAKRELKKEIIDLSLQAAQHLVQEKLTESQDKALVKEFLDKLDTVEKE